MSVVPPHFSIPDTLSSGQLDVVGNQFSVDPGLVHFGPPLRGPAGRSHVVNEPY